MKQYLVVRTEENQETAYNAPIHDVQGRRFSVNSPLYKLDNFEDISSFNGEYPVYSADKAEDAEALAKYLATQKPGTTWVVSNATSTFRSIPGPVSKAVYTSAGLVPAAV